MAKYNDFIYGTGVLYGEKGKIALSAEPMAATALDYGTIQVDYTIPSGDYVGFRIVRNQDSYPETEDDGVIITEKIPGVDTTLESSILDTNQNPTAPLQMGRFAYYRAWILVATDSSWVPAGDAYVLSPMSNAINIGTDAVQSKYGGVNVTSDEPITHSYELSSTHRRFLDTLPRVLTSATNNPVDEINNPDGVQDGENTVISKFLSAFSFTLDEVFTNVSLLNSDITGWSTNPAILQLMAHEFGIEGTGSDITKTTKRLIREAPYIYKRKGTLAGLSAYTEATTGFNSTITQGKNLLLSYEDSTFLIPDWEDGVVNETVADPVGGWATVPTDITLSVSAEEATQTGITKSLDSSFSCKAVVANSNSSMELGTNAPMLYGIPVTAGSAYSLSAYMFKSGGSTKVARLKVNWYDKQGGFISQSVSSDITVGTSWNRESLANQVAPTKATYAGLLVEFETTGTYYVDMVQFEKSATVTAYEEPRSVSVFLNPYKTNFFVNPSFENSLTGWTVKGATTSTALISTDTWSGNYRAHLTASGSAQLGFESAFVSVTPGEAYYSYMYIKDFDTNKSYYASAKFYDSSDTLLSAAPAIGEMVDVATSRWTQVGVSIVIPTGAAKVKVSFLSEEAPAAGKDAFFDAAIFIQGNGPVTFFDGSYEDRGCSWAGTANNSVSYFYPNRSSKLDRLAATINYMLPLQTPYYIDCYGIETLSGRFSGIS